MGDFSGDSFGTGDMSGGFSGMGDFSGGSSGMSGFSGGSASFDTGSFSGSGMSAGSMGQGMGSKSSAMDGSSLSILGSAYDLTSAETLLEREPSDSDAAEDLLEELKESKEDIEKQYEELLRKEKIYRLQIQYTYDDAILTGKLAEITYQQEVESWDSTLQSALDNITSLEEEQALLTACENGILLAEKSGTLSSVNYSAEDIVNSRTPVVSFYNTDVVTISLQVPQDEIAQFQVGNTVDVTIGGRSGYEGTITEKAVEPEDGTPMGDVEYVVTISVNNENGRLSSGSAASVTIPDQTGENINEQ